LDYADDTENYEIPNIYFYFRFSKLEDTNTTEDLEADYWTKMRINSTFQKLLESQNYFEGRVWTTYVFKNNSIVTMVHTLEAVNIVFEDEWVVGDYFYGGIQLKLSNPSFDFVEWISDIVFTNNVDENVLLSHYSITINREYSPLDWLDTISFGYLNDGWKLFEIHYTEMVTHKLEDSNSIGRRRHSDRVSTFEFSQDEVIWHEEPALNFLKEWENTTGFMITLVPTLKIEHWEEYIEYDRWDWVAAMGGMLSLLSVVFFFVARYIAVRFSKSSMGILPHMSLVFDNYERIHMTMLESESI